jgi:coatomer protein complex subunit gamma
VWQEPIKVSDYAEELKQHPEFANLGPIFKSAEPLLLTEEETEYNISVITHVFEEHVLLQFNCNNTVQEQVLENVSVVVDLAEAVCSFAYLSILSLH